MVNESEANQGTPEIVHSNQLLKGLNQLRQRHELCDVELCAGKNRVSAHRVVLSACSPYFNAMFTGKLLESQKQVIYLKDIDESALHILVDFAYTGKRPSFAASCQHAAVKQGQGDMLSLSQPTASS